MTSAVVELRAWLGGLLLVGCWRLGRHRPHRQAGAEPWPGLERLEGGLALALHRGGLVQRPLEALEHVPQVLGPQWRRHGSDRALSLVPLLCHRGCASTHCQT